MLMALTEQGGNVQKQMDNISRDGNYKKEKIQEILKKN